MPFPRQEYWSGLPFPSLGDLSDPGTEPTSPVALADWQVDSLPLSHLRSPNSHNLLQQAPCILQIYTPLTNTEAA